MSDFGARREREVRDLLEAEGWVVIKAGGSLGAFDLAAFRAGVIRLIEVKGTAAGPFHSFGPEKRQLLREVAAQAGGIAELAFWPKRAKPQFIPAEAWPN